MNKQQSQDQSEAEVTLPHTLQPLLDQLSGSQHNAGSAVKALENFIEGKLNELRAELHPKAFAKVEGEKT